MNLLSNRVQTVDGSQDDERTQEKGRATITPMTSVQPGTTCTVKSTPDTPRKAGGSKFWSYAGLATVNPRLPPYPAENCEAHKQITRESRVPRVLDKPAGTGFWGGTGCMSFGIRMDIQETTMVWKQSNPRKKHD